MHWPSGSMAFVANLMIMSDLACFCSVHLPMAVKASEDLSNLDAYPTVQTLSSPRACRCGCRQALSLFSGILNSVFASSRRVIRIVGSFPASIVRHCMLGFSEDKNYSFRCHPETSTASFLVPNFVPSRPSRILSDGPKAPG